MVYTLCAVMKSRITLDARLRYILATDIAAFVAAAALVFIVSRIHSLVSSLAAWLLAAALLAGFAVDIVLWLVMGIRRVELDGEELTLTVGRARRVHRLTPRDVTRVHVTTRLGRRAVVIRTVNGPRIRIPEDAFPREPFGRFTGALEEWSAGR